MTAQNTLAYAALLVSNQRWRDAVAVLGPHLASNPDDGEAWRLMARCQLGMDRPRSAEDAAQRALAIEPDSEWAHRLISIAYLDREIFSSARRAAEEAIRLDPNSWQAHHQRAHVDVEEGVVNRRTWAAARRAVELAPEEPQAHLLLGLVALQSKNRSLAAAEFREALALDPNNAMAANNLAVVQSRRRRLASAGALFSSALRSSPNERLFAANLRGVLRAWAMLLNLLGFIGCLILLSVTAGHSEPMTPNLAGPTPEITLTLGPTEAVTLPVPPSYLRRHIAVIGRPAALIVVTCVLVAALAAVVAAVRRSVGPTAGRILMASIRADRPLLITIVSCLTGVVLLCAAALAGMPTARALITAAFITFITAALVNRIIGRKRVPS